MSAITVSVLIVGKRAYGTGSLRVKHGAWYGSWRTVDGRRTMRKIAAVRSKTQPDGLTKTQAEQALREMLVTDAETAARAARRHDPTIEQLGERLKARLERDGRKRSHIEGVGYHLSTHINPLLGERPASDIDPRDVQRLVDRMLRDGKASKTVRNVAGTLHSVLAIAVDAELLARNPCDMAKLPTAKTEPAIRFLTQAELERVLVAEPPEDATQAERDWWPAVRLLVLTAAMTGMRLGELRALCWQDLDMAAMKVRVRYSFVRGELGSPKSRRSVRAIPLGARLVTELDEHHRSTPWNADADLVLAHPHTGRPLDRVRLLVHFKAALQRANVRPVRIHDLRHTFATTVAASGKVSMRTLQEWMGHANIQTTLIYADYMPGEREAELIDDAFGAAGSKRAPFVANTTRHEPT
ncbi:MAG: tyrosine-type recombinase/integrase [Solirubrobacteraceae bacterium]